jgi:hypothetical protein
MRQQGVELFALQSMFSSTQRVLVKLGGELFIGKSTIDHFDDLHGFLPDSWNGLEHSRVASGLRRLVCDDCRSGSLTWSMSTACGPEDVPTAVELRWRPGADQAAASSLLVVTVAIVASSAGP